MTDQKLGAFMNWAATQRQEPETEEIEAPSAMASEACTTSGCSEPPTCGAQCPRCDAVAKHFFTTHIQVPDAVVLQTQADYGALRERRLTDLSPLWSSSSPVIPHPCLRRRCKQAARPGGLTCSSKCANLVRGKRLSKEALVRIDVVVLPLRLWSRIFGISPSTLSSRIHRKGMTAHAAVTTPVNGAMARSDALKKHHDAKRRNDPRRPGW